MVGSYRTVYATDCMTFTALNRTKVRFLSGKGALWEWAAVSEQWLVRVC